MLISPAISVAKPPQRTTEFKFGTTILSDRRGSRGAEVVQLKNSKIDYDAEWNNVS
jgi:hypothetical protein